MGRLLLVSLLVMLNMPAFFTSTTGMDQYGFFTLGPAKTWPWPLVLSIALSTSAAGVGYLAYWFLWRRQSWFTGDSWGAFRRNALLFGVPVAIAFAPGFFLTSLGGKPTMVAVAGLMAGSLCVTAALYDRDMQLDTELARIWFVVCIAIILVFLTLSISAMLMMYFVEQSPATGNFFWTWHFAWSDLGYPAEQFNERQRHGLLAFTLTGSGFMIVVLGGSLLGAVLRWTRPDPATGPGRPVEEAAQPPPAEAVPDWFDEALAAPEDTPTFVAVLNGREAAISRSRYEQLLADKERLLLDTTLLVDKASGTAFAKSGRDWRKISFRGRRKGPFLLLCIYARHPGRRFAVGELEVLLEADLPGREGLNVSDIFAQLQKRAPLVPVVRDAYGSYIPETVKVCFLDRQP